MPFHYSILVHPGPSVARDRILHSSKALLFLVPLTNRLHSLQMSVVHIMSNCVEPIMLLRMKKVCLETLSFNAWDSPSAAKEAERVRGRKRRQEHQRAIQSTPMCGRVSLEAAPHHIPVIFVGDPANSDATAPVMPAPTSSGRYQRFILIPFIGVHIPMLLNVASSISNALCASHTVVRRLFVTMPVAYFVIQLLVRPDYYYPSGTYYRDAEPAYSHSGT